MSEGLSPEEHGLLLISDIPKQLDLFQKNFIVIKTEPVCGTVVNYHNSYSKVEFSIHDAVKKTFDRLPTTVMIIKDMADLLHKLDSGKCLLFDSHSRDERGKPSTDRKAALLSFDNCDRLGDFFIEFTNKLEGKLILFEFVGLDCPIAPNL